MGSRQLAVMNLSLSPETAKEYKEIANAEGKTASGLFRDMFSLYKREKLQKEYRALQDYGADQARALNISEAEIERPSLRDDSVRKAVFSMPTSTSRRSLHKAEGPKKPGCRHLKGA
jgi:hypothetical protein